MAHKADREYIWHFYDERSNDMAAVEEVRRAFGFCAEHIEMLRRIDVEDMKTTLRISVLFADTFAGIVDQLQALAPDAAFDPAQCPACASRHEYLHRNAEYLLDMLATTPGYRSTFESSPGLCFPHSGSPGSLLAPVATANFCSPCSSGRRSRCFTNCASTSANTTPNTGMNRRARSATRGNARSS